MITCCASCGKAEVDDVKLKICTGCNLVRYCSVECQKNHRKQHKKACKERMAEIRDDNLFTPPEISHLGECPICCLPLDLKKWTVSSCCCKIICLGCDYANQLREFEEGLERKCSYCREPLPKNQEEVSQNYMERAKANDPVAFFRMGSKCKEEGDLEGAFEYWIKAAELGNMMAHHNISCVYRDGEGVEKNIKKEVYHMEEAAIGGHDMARFNLGCYEGKNKRHEKAIKHFIIAANLGLDESLRTLKEYFRRGLVGKEDYEAALRGHQAAVDATKSQQREEAYAFHNLSPEEQHKRWVQFSRH